MVILDHFGSSNLWNSPKIIISLKIRGLFVTLNYFEHYKMDFFGFFFSIFKLIILNIFCYSTAITLTSLRFNMLILLVEPFRLYLKIEHQIEHLIENFFDWPILNFITNWPLYNFMTHISLSFHCTEAVFDCRILIYFRK